MGPHAPTRDPESAHWLATTPRTLERASFLLPSFDPALNLQHNEVNLHPFGFCDHTQARGVIIGFPGAWLETSINRADLLLPSSLYASLSPFSRHQRGRTA